MTGVVGVLIAMQVDPGELLAGCADVLNIGLVIAVTTSPIALGAAAIHVAMLSASGLLRIANTSIRGKDGALRRAWGVIATWAWLGSALSQVVLAARADLSGYCSAPMLILPATAVVFPLVMSGLGILLGAAYRHWAAGVIGAGAAFIVVLGVQQLEGNAGRFVPTSIYTTYQPFFEPNVPLGVGRILVYGALIALVWLVLSATLRARVVSAVTVAMLGATGIGIGSTASPEPVAYRTPPEAVCQMSSRAEFCVWPESVQALDRGLDAINLIVGIVDDRFPTPTRFSQEGLTPLTEPGVMRFDSRSFARDDLELAAIRSLVPEPNCSAGLDAWFDIIDWVSAVRSPEFATPEVARVRAQEDAVQREWLDERYTIATEICD
ncbi:hypothetical protein [Microcella putealis]|uniref:hypothetical protein n=1 Tax=Microcella putealis TaxID=337005 RepID=UPI00102D27CD|nr:hypothetical protein [Microcella putealis]